MASRKPPKRAKARKPSARRPVAKRDRRQSSPKRPLKRPVKSAIESPVFSGEGTPQEISWDDFFDKFAGFRRL